MSLQLAAPCALIPIPESCPSLPDAVGAMSTKRADTAARQYPTMSDTACTNQKACDKTAGTSLRVQALLCELYRLYTVSGRYCAMRIQYCYE